jgi:hypothetical protein
MNRERAETFLRLLAEAELRDPALPSSLAPLSADGAFGTLPVAVHRAAWALTAVGALDQETADGILADVELAVATRGRAEPPEAGVTGSAGPRWAAGQAASRRFAHARLAMRQSAGRTPSAPAPPPRAGPARPGPDRYVPVGLMILFHDETISGELDLMSYAHTAGGARFTAGWRTRDPLGSRRHDLPPVEAFTVTDDRGNGYDLLFDTKGRAESICDLSLRPDPPPDIGWLEVTAPGEQAVRVDLDRRVIPVPEVTDIDLSVGEHLLNRIAERLLLAAAEFPAQPVAGTRASLAVSLGAAIAALEAAEVLPTGSPVAGRLAALCVSLGLSGHGITAAPAPDLPEPWLSLLSHYHRRKPGPAPAGDGFAAVAAALPELDGLRVVLLGLHNYDGGTWMNTLTLGQLPVNHPGPLGLDMTFPLSVWVRDDAGRWHVARPSGWYAEDGEASLTLRLTPPLARSSDWIEVLASGRTAEVRATLPLRWGYSQ